MFSELVHAWHPKLSVGECCFLMIWFVCYHYAQGEMLEGLVLTARCHSTQSGVYPRYAEPIKTWDALPKIKIALKGLFI
jgi:hypothetical protein